MAADARRYLLAGKYSITEQATWQGNMADRPDRPDRPDRLCTCNAIHVSSSASSSYVKGGTKGWLACSGVPALAAPGLVPDDDGWMKRKSSK